jgi:hypothetical protein
MAAITRVYTIKYAAEMLNADEELLRDIHTRMAFEDGALWIHDGTEHGTAGFTNPGLDNLRESLRDKAFIAAVRK